MMKCNPGQLRLFVKSQKVPIGIMEFSRPTTSGLWALSQQSTRAVVYGQMLDETQARLVEDARRLSEKSGLCLEVVDLSKMSFLRRVFWSRIVGAGPTITSANLGLIATGSRPARTFS